jgi:hypothetical protein
VLMMWLAFVRAWWTPGVLVRERQRLGPADRYQG